ncbi:MAG: hypothetical protein CM15mP74_05730 [Halieaceae bacterium]|nr:MAG: hypothetical protein CM15mP74_05730 [Halieaceae bacterium]
MTKIKMCDKSVRAGSTRTCSRSLAMNRWIMMLGVSVALTCSHGVLAEEVANFARLALSCVHKEYPNHISHTLQGDTDVAPPRELTPAFYGCLDWHSSVHGHWLLARLARLYPESAFAEAARAALAQSLTEANLLAETQYVSAKVDAPLSALTALPGYCSWRQSLKSGMTLRPVHGAKRSGPSKPRWSSG